MPRRDVYALQILIMTKISGSMHAGVKRDMNYLQVSLPIMPLFAHMKIAFDIWTAPFIVLQALFLMCKCIYLCQVHSIHAMSYISQDIHHVILDKPTKKALHKLVEMHPAGFRSFFHGITESLELFRQQSVHP